jgi:excisionase family DNA binding protein
MKFSSGVGVLRYWYEYGPAVREYAIPAVFINEDNEGKAPYLALENFDYPDWWYTWIDIDKIIRKLSRQDWALIIHYFKFIYHNAARAYYSWEARDRFGGMCQRIFSMLDSDEYKHDRGRYRSFDRVMLQIKGRMERGEIDVTKIEPHGIYTATEVADILRYTTETIHTMLKAGKLKGVKPGGNEWRISGQAVLDLMGIGNKRGKGNG